MKYIKQCSSYFIVSCGRRQVSQFVYNGDEGDALSWGAATVLTPKIWVVLLCSVLSLFFAMCMALGFPQWISLLGSVIFTIKRSTIDKINLTRHSWDSEDIFPKKQTTQQIQVRIFDLIAQQINLPSGIHGT